MSHPEPMGFTVHATHYVPAEGPSAFKCIYCLAVKPSDLMRVCPNVGSVRADLRVHPTHEMTEAGIACRACQAASGSTLAGPCPKASTGEKRHRLGTSQRDPLAVACWDCHAEFADAKEAEQAPCRVDGRVIAPETSILIDMLLKLDRKIDQVREEMLGLAAAIEKTPGDGPRVDRLLAILESLTQAHPSED